MGKRPRAEPENGVEASTPRKVRRSPSKGDDVHNVASRAIPFSTAETPSKRRSILRGTPSKISDFAQPEPTPKSLRKVLFSTPSGAKDQVEGADDQTPTAVHDDRSAHSKSLRILHRQDDHEEQSDDEDAAHDEAIAEQILQVETESEEGDGDDSIAVAEPSSTADATLKAGRPRGRPKGRRRERTPSPPSNLPPHELYFFQNRAGGNKTSSNTLPSRLLLKHEDYLAQMHAYKDPHEQDIDRLKRLHKRGFDQWMFELRGNFSICLYGYGSKRNLVMEFAEHVYYQADPAPKIVVVNGYTPGLTVRDVLTTLASVVLPKNNKLPAQPTAILDLLLSTFSDVPSSPPILLIVHSLDHSNLRKAATQSILAQLAAHPSISLLATCDTPNFPLLWDIALTRQFRFLFHDATTFEPYRVEIDAVEEVNALLGRSSRRLGGKDGVAYVLKSLPENARNLFRILVAEQLALADVEPDPMRSELDNDDLDYEDMLGVDNEEDAAVQQETPTRRGRGRPKKKANPARPAKPRAAAPEGVEYRTLYHKAVEEFVCSSELNFRTLLKEFHDHQMIESRKDGMGTERLIVPFRREELETILEELT